MKLSRARCPELLRFIDQTNGPVLSISSVPYPSLLCRRLWHSTAQLHPKMFSNHAKLSVMGCCGGGWSADKEESQIKAVVEAVERWAFFSYSTDLPEQAGINIDASSNGFAAIPTDMGQKVASRNAYCEALERWVLNRIWDNGNIPLERPELRSRVLGDMLKPLCVEASCFSTRISTEELGGAVPPVAHFCLCLLRTRLGGAISGAACSSTPELAIERAALEAYLHAVAFERMLARRLSVFESVIEKRLFHFARMQKGYEIVSDRIEIAASANLLKSPPVLFSKNLPGPWNPEISVHRVLLCDSKPILDGGLERFFI